MHTIDGFLGGRVRLTQPSKGYRVSMDTILLAASIPAQAGDKILEAGIGSGGAAICLAHRVSGTTLTGLELQDEMIDCVKKNIKLNDMDQRFEIINGDIMVPPPELKMGSFDHVMANPPYIADGKAIKSTSESKGLSHMDQSGTVKGWVNFCVSMARYKGTVTFIYRADRLDELLSRLHGKVGDLKLCPLWPHQDESAKLVLLQGRKGVSGGMSILPGLVLHDDNEGYTERAEAILRDGKELDLGTIKPMKSSSSSKSRGNIA